MLQRPIIARFDLSRLLPLALLLGALIGLVAGAVTSQVPELRQLGPELGRDATLWGALLGALVSWLGLALARSALLERTAYLFEPDGLYVSWPGFSVRVPWHDIVDVERFAGNLRLRIAGSRPLVLFGITDPDQVEALIRVRMSRPEPEQDSERAA